MNKKPAKEGNNKEWKNYIITRVNIDCESIWGEGPTSYLVYVVK